MAYYQILFSPTGGTKKAADLLTDSWSEVKKIDLSVLTDFENVFCPEDIVLVAMPSFGGLAPDVAVERFSRMKGNGARCILLAVYGNRAYEDTLTHMEEGALKAGFQIIAAAAAAAEHSIMHQYAAGRPDTSDAAQLRGFAEKINAKLQSGDLSQPAYPGNRPVKKAGGGLPAPKAGKACRKCGLCASKCPVGAISAASLNKTDSSKCIACMRCVAICPEHARGMNRLMVSAAAFAMKKACSGRKENELYL